jgi:hypothetical protein
MHSAAALLTLFFIDHFNRQATAACARVISGHPVSLWPQTNRTSSFPHPLAADFPLPVAGFMSNQIQSPFATTTPAQTPLHSNIMPLSNAGSSASNPQAPMPLLDLRIGNKYKIGRKIGSGSFGDIYLGALANFWDPVSVADCACFALRSISIAAFRYQRHQRRRSGH